MPIVHNQPLKPFNTFNVAASARYFIEVDSAPMIQAALAELPTEPTLILGSGSNILLTEDFQGLVIKNIIKGIEPILEDNDHIWLTIGAGVIWHELVMHCLSHNYAGIENLSLIPGTVGAAPIQNIGAYGVEFDSVFESLQAINLTTHQQQSFTHADCQFGYRDSIFKNTLKNQFIVTHVTIKLNKQPKINIDYGNIKYLLNEMKIDKPTIQDVSRAVIAIRQQKLPDPKILANAGSFFKNPMITADLLLNLQQQFPDIPHFKSADQFKIPAAWLIEQCNLKGIKQNEVGTYEKHGLILVNYKNESGLAIKQLAEKIQNDVLQKFQIKLQPEVNIL